MKISAMNNTSFNGKITFYRSTEKTDFEKIEIDANHITGVKSDMEGTKVNFKAPMKDACGRIFKGVYKDDSIVVAEDINTVINAYNTSKNSDFNIDFTI